MLEVVAVNTWRKPEQAAIEPLTECADFSHAEGDRLTEAKALIGIGMLHLLNAPPDFEAAEEALQKAFDLAESLADPYCTAMVGMVIGWTHTLRGDLPKAIETLDACMANGQSIGDGLILGSLHSARGWAALLAGDTDRAEEDFREHLLIASTIGHEPGVGYALEGLFATASTRGDVEHAGHLLGAAEAIRQRKGNTAAAAVASFHGHWVRKIERSPHAAQFEQARNGGRGLDPAAAVELALHEGDPVMSRGDG
jgi:hypothetical protein